ncbi:MAG: response regulator [Candidatus Omnitrophota bacterium]
MTKILFVDDNKSFLDAMARYLAWYDFQVNTLEDSSSVISHCQNHVYDLCIFDTFSQPLSGYQLVDLIKSHINPTIRHMKILVIFEEEPQLQRFIFMRKHGVYAMMKYSSVERWVENISAIVQKPFLIS